MKNKDSINLELLSQALKEKLDIHLNPNIEEDVLELRAIALELAEDPEGEKTLAILSYLSSALSSSIDVDAVVRPGGKIKISDRPPVPEHLNFFLKGKSYRTSRKIDNDFKP